MRLHVLQRMHGEIDAPVEQCFFDFLREEALAADLGEPAGLHPVAGGADRQQLDRACDGQLGMSSAQPVAHQLGLVKRHRAAARTDAKRPGRHCCSSRACGAVLAAAAEQVQSR